MYILKLNIVITECNIEYIYLYLIFIYNFNELVYIYLLINHKKKERNIIFNCYIELIFQFDFKLSFDSLAYPS